MTQALLTPGFRRSPGCSFTWPCLSGEGHTDILGRQEEGRARSPESCPFPRLQNSRDVAKMQEGSREEHGQVGHQPLIVSEALN